MTGQELIKQFLVDETGATAIEYGLIAGMMAIVVISIAATGGALDTIYDRLVQLVNALGGAAP